MKLLNFGCKRSDFSTGNVRGNIFVQCRFYEEGREKPYTYRRYAGAFTLESDRKTMMKILQKEMQTLLDEKDYNPRTKQFMFSEGELNPYLSMKDALWKTLERKEVTPEHRKNVETHLKRFFEILPKLGLDYLKIKDVELLHVKKALEHLNLTNYGFNKAKIHLSSLFTDLVDEGCLKVNPCTGIKSKKHIKKEKELFSDDELAIIADHIKSEVPHFENFFYCFFYSGCRIPEMLGLQRKDIDLDRLEFTITLKKGGYYIREKRAIIKNAIPYWESQLETALFEDDYIFSYFYQPERKEMHRDLVYKFWTKHIMKPTGIPKTIYTLKHTFLDKVEEANYSAQIAAGHRRDTTTAIYTIGREKRRLQAQKMIELEAI